MILSLQETRLKAGWDNSHLVKTKRLGKKRLENYEQEKD